MVFDVIFTPTYEELLDGLRRAELRRAGKGRLIVQTVLLLAVAAWAMIAFFADAVKQPMSLVIGIVALVLIPVMWFVPELQMKSMARQMAENGTVMHLWVFEDGVDFGDRQPDGAYYAFSRFFCDFPKEDTLQTLVWRFQNDDVVVVPRRALSEEQWQLLCEKTAVSVAAQRRHL